MPAKPAAYIVGAFEHPTRHAPDKSLAQLHAEVAKGALEDAGLEKSAVDAYFCAGDAPGVGAFNMAEYMGLNLSHMDSTETGGSSPLVHIAHAASEIAAGRCQLALVTLAGRPRAGGTGTSLKGLYNPNDPAAQFEAPYRAAAAQLYAMCAMRHMYEFGTTSEQLAWIRVAASHHAQYNPNAMLPKPVTVEEVLDSPMITDPLRKLDCCVVSDGGGAVLVASPQIAASCKRPRIAIRGRGEALKHTTGGKVDLTSSAGKVSGAAAFAEARVSPADIKYASIYDSFTITVLMALEDLGFCNKGEGGKFVSDGNLICGVGKLPFNSDGGGLCNNHPGNRGGITKVIEAVRQLRAEAHPKVQVENCNLALAHGTGGHLATRHSSATLILERL